ncbi:MAG: hypothetical protein M3T49_02130 [Candidatus Eremiobacteraeota bacterium]|nr:hypothetical protein [Candidatus Eremiobacteraeota bacterium]
MAKLLLLQFDTDPQCAARRDVLSKIDVQLAEDEPRWPSFFRTVTRIRPDVIVVACSRIPSHGREAARYLSEGFNTRDIPLIIVGVAEHDLEKTRDYVPRATIVGEENLASAVRERLPASV